MKFFFSGEKQNFQLWDYSKGYWDFRIFRYQIKLILLYLLLKVNRKPRNILPRAMKHYSPSGRTNHGRPLKRLLDMWERNGSTSGPTPWQIYDDDDDDDDDEYGFKSDSRLGRKSQIFRYLWSVTYAFYASCVLMTINMCCVWLNK